MSTLRKVDLERREVNRKLILGVLVGTGMISAGLWGWGEIRRSAIWEPEVVRVELGGATPTGVRIKREGKWKSLVATASGTWAVYVYEIEKETEYGFGENEVMPAASIMKIPALVAAEAKKGETWVLEEADRSLGSGPLQYLRAGTEVTVERVMTELGKKSDNTAWVMINRRMGYTAMEKIVSEWGLKNTSYRGLTTTAADVGIMMRKIYERPELWSYLEDSIYEDRISLGLPQGTRLVHKVGTDTGVWADAGIIMPEIPNPKFQETNNNQETNSNNSNFKKAFILVILNRGVVREEAARLVPEITKQIWEKEAGD